LIPESDRLAEAAPPLTVPEVAVPTVVDPSLTVKVTEPWFGSTFPPTLATVAVSVTLESPKTADADTAAVVVFRAATVNVGAGDACEPLSLPLKFAVPPYEATIVYVPASTPLNGKLADADPFETVPLTDDPIVAEPLFTVNVTVPAFGVAFPPNACTDADNVTDPSPKTALAAAAVVLVARCAIEKVCGTSGAAL
jgi:hypothetical protein